MTLHAPNDNDPAHFKETDVFIETFFDEIIHQYKSEVLTSLPERYEHKRIPLRVRCAELKLQLNNCTLKRDTALTQNLGEGYQVRQTRTKLRNIAQSENHQTEKSLEASGGINAGKFFNFALSGLFKQTDAKEKSQNASEEVSLEIINTNGPMVIEPQGKSGFRIGSEAWGDPSSTFDDDALSGAYPKLNNERTRPPFCTLIPNDGVDEYGYTATLRVNFNHVLWNKATLSNKGNRELMEQLVQMQLSNGYERDDHSQYLILQTASLQVFKSKPEAIAQIEHKGQSALPKGLSADVAVAFDGAQDLSLPALDTIAQQYTQIQPKKMLLGVDLSSAFYRKEDIKTLNLDPVTHQGATLVTGQEIKEYSRDPAGFEARRAFEVAHQQDLEDWKTGPFDGGIYSDGNTYSAEDAQKAFGKAVEHIKLAFDGAKQTLDLSGNVEERSPLTHLPRSIAHCTAIRDLNLSNTKITSLEPIKNMAGMQNLDLSNTMITSLELIKNMVGMETLSLSGTKITSLELIKNMAGMQILELRGTEIADLGPIADLIRGGLVMTGVDDDRISAIKAATGGDPLAGDPLSRDEG